MSLAISFIVLISAAPQSSSFQAEPSLQPVKLLNQGEDYPICHISTPSDDRQVTAIAVDNHFYRFCCIQTDPAVTLDLLQTASAEGKLTVMTATQREYRVWVHEPLATLAPSTDQTPRPSLSAFGAANCWIIGDRPITFCDCTLNVPDFPDAVSGIAYRQKLFSFYCREQDAHTALNVGSSLSQRGDELVISMTEDAYAVYLYEPGATITQ
ncbi:MAG: hypothetical protein ACFB0E_11105 [Leptolyngbyaceae cyanobacterium]